MLIFSRRNFLKLASRVFLALSGGLSIGGLFRFFGHPVESTPQAAVDLGLAADFPLGSRTILPEVPAVLYHTDRGFRALSLVCTHLGCTIKSEVDGFLCACHGSRFSENGEVLHGPAEDPLPELRLELTESGHLVLYPADHVDSVTDSSTPAL
jgi:cytochrome b6-f complex iron-sulfur subunit